MSTVIEKKKARIVLPFGVEIDTPRNADVMLQSIPGCRLRGRIDASKPVIISKIGERGIPANQLKSSGVLPKIPGQQIHVNPDKLIYTIIDPLCDDENLCEQIRKGLENLGTLDFGSKLQGVPSVSGELDVHRMKTLCRELLWMLDTNYAKMVKGPKPDMEDIEELPGNFLLNPGSRIHNGQPQYEKDFPNWLDRLSRSGG